MRRISAALLLLLATPVAAQEGTEVSRYDCEDGRSLDAAFLRLGEHDLAILSVDGAQPVVLSTALAASGARYVGAGLQWWTKGLEANLAPLGEGEDIASDPGTTCHAAG
jgi:membrane-bound inhibitor of C-type lysozyme